MKAFRFSWRRWKTHTTNCQLYWRGSLFLEALFEPSVGQLAHYLGERSMSGPQQLLELILPSLAARKL